MMIRRTRSPRSALAIAVLVCAVATPLMGAAAWQGLQLESSFPIDTQQARADVTLDVAASAFVFDPVVLTIEDKPKKAKKVIELRIRLKNNSDRDYYVYATANLFDADGKPIASRSDKAKADDYDRARLAIRFQLPYSDAERVKRCDLRFAFEKE